MQDPQLYRTKEEVEEYRKRDPIALFQDKLRAAELIDDQEIKQIEQQVEAEVDDALQFAEESPVPDPSTLLDHLYAAPEK
jgi:pyruvate dehydrogenase E1 component alpha subunit